MRLIGLANNITVLGGKITELEIMKEMVHVDLKLLEQVAILIEMLLDLDILTVEEVTGHLRNVDQQKKRTASDKQGSLLTEEWHAHMRNRNNSDAGSSSSRKSGKKQAEKKKDSIDGPTPGKCPNCGKKGHWAKDCWSKLKKGRAHVAQTVEEEESSLFQTTIGDFFANTSAPKQGGDGKNSNGGGAALGEDQQPMAIEEYLGLGVDGASD
jgi:hypothetical protein